MNSYDKEKSSIKSSGWRRERKLSSTENSPEVIEMIQEKVVKGLSSAASKIGR